jgi:hypothetical protein
MAAPDSALALALGGYAGTFVRWHLWKAVRENLGPQGELVLDVKRTQVSGPRNLPPGDWGGPGPAPPPVTESFREALSRMTPGFDFHCPLNGSLWAAVVFPSRSIVFRSLCGASDHWSTVLSAEWSGTPWPSPPAYANASVVGLAFARDEGLLYCALSATRQGTAAGTCFNSDSLLFFASHRVVDGRVSRLEDLCPREYRLPAQADLFIAPGLGISRCGSRLYVALAPIPPLAVAEGRDGGPVQSSLVSVRVLNAKDGSPLHAWETTFSEEPSLALTNDEIVVLLAADRSSPRYTVRTYLPTGVPLRHWEVTGLSSCVSLQFDSERGEVILLGQLLCRVVGIPRAWHEDKILAYR